MLMVLATPKEGREKEYNEWYENHHVKEVCRLPGFMRCERFSLSTSELKPGGQITTTDTRDPSKSVMLVWNPLSIYEAGKSG
jgi:hypothetical protein